MFYYSHGPSHPPIGVPHRPPPLHIFYPKSHVLTYHKTHVPHPNDWVWYYYDDTHFTNQPNRHLMSHLAYDLEQVHHVSFHLSYPCIPRVPISHS